MLPRIRSQCDHYSDGYCQDNDEGNGSTGMKWSEQKMIFNLHLYFLLFVDPLSQQFDQLEYLYFGSPFVDCLRNRDVVIGRSGDGVCGLFEGILFGNVDME